MICLFKIKTSLNRPKPWHLNSPHQLLRIEFFSIINWYIQWYIHTSPIFHHHYQTTTYTLAIGVWDNKISLSLPYTQIIIFFTIQKLCEYCLFLITALYNNFFSAASDMVRKYSSLAMTLKHPILFFSYNFWILKNIIIWI